MARHLHVVLTDGQHAYLKAESARTGLSMGELVRRALDETYRPEARRRVRGFDVGLGIWRVPDAALVGRRAGTR
jgi:hypothetical protein